MTSRETYDEDILLAESLYGRRIRTQPVFPIGELNRARYLTTTYCYFVLCRDSSEICETHQGR